MSVQWKPADVVDEDLRTYIAARLRSSGNDAQCAGKWVARRKADAVVVAAAGTYEGIEDAMASAGIDPETVVLGFVPEPGDIHVV